MNRREPHLENRWNADELSIFGSLESPVAIQAFLDTVPYSSDPVYRSPRSVLRDRKAHCFDGAMFAAAALRRLGYRPLVLDMLAERDDDHLLALFKEDNCWGSIAKSNFVGLRYRDPIFRSLRELVMSYFEDFYNIEGEKTLRGYTVPLDLSRFDRLDWMMQDEALDAVADALDRQRTYDVISPAQAGRLPRMDKRSYEAGMLGVNPDGLWRPDKA
ncbi:MAG TPA: hypothetical protein PLP29_12820 [Candidatus Ozemobacteraceae bacterium]|nr:hypothetical protein [Candidatus Ozemobacteraceae bacterium]